MIDNVIYSSVFFKENVMQDNIVSLKEKNLNTIDKSEYFENRR